jgi:hypothetical protein
MPANIFCPFHQISKQDIDLQAATKVNNNGGLLNG